jgi:acetyl-CoA carboxylase carboxyltransferase component
MGGEAAAKTLLQIEVASLKAQGKTIDSQTEEKMLNDIKSRYEKETSPYYAAARLWVDEIIDPAQTRRMVAEGIAAADHNPEIAELRTGVFQV